MAILKYLLLVLPCGRPLTCMSVVEACEIIQLRQRNGRFWSWSMHITRFRIIFGFQFMFFNCFKVFKKPNGLNLKLTDTLPRKNLLCQIYRQNWQCCLAGSSKTAPKSLIFSMAMGADYSFEIISIETYAPPIYLT